MIAVKRCRRLSGDAQCLMVRLGMPGHHVDEIQSSREVHHHLHGATAGRRHQGAAVSGMDPLFRVPVGIEVDRLDGHRLALAEQALGQGELGPERRAEMRQVEPAEDAMPVGIIALGPPDGPACRGRVAAFPAERGEREHRLVQPIRFGVFRQEVAPVPAAEQAALDAGESRLTPRVLEAEQRPRWRRW